MPTTKGNLGTPLTPQQTLTKLTGLITEIGDEPPESPESEVPEPAPAPTPPEIAPQPSETEPPASEEPDDTTVDVVVDGETETVPLSELKKGYSRQADYTRKTQALAEERKALRSQVEAEALAAVQQDRLQYQQGLKQLAQALEQLQGEPDWVDLRGKLEPGEFLKQKADWEASKAQVEKLKAHEAEVSRQAQEAQAREYLKVVQAEQDKLRAAIPEWEKPEVAKAEHAKLLAAGQQYGFSEQEIRAVTDHRAILLLRDAMRWRELKRDAAPRPKTAGIKTAKPGTPDRPRPGAEFQKKLDRVQKTGRARDAMDAIADLIE